MADWGISSLHVASFVIRSITGTRVFQLQLPGGGGGDTTSTRQRLALMDASAGEDDGEVGPERVHGVYLLGPPSLKTTS